AAAPQFLRERNRLRCRRMPRLAAARHRCVPGLVRPEELVQRRRVAQRDRRLCVRNRRLDLAAVTDDPGVFEEPVDVALAVAGDAVGFEAGECRAKPLALAQDRQPREPRLKALETEPLVEPPLLADRPAPLLVVVDVVARVGRRPAPNDLLHSTTSTWTIPSSTVTGYVATGS